MGRKEKKVQEDLRTLLVNGLSHSGDTFLKGNFISVWNTIPFNTKNKLIRKYVPSSTASSFLYNCSSPNIEFSANVLTCQQIYKTIFPMYKLPSARLAMNFI